MTTTHSWYRHLSSSYHLLVIIYMLAINGHSAAEAAASTTSEPIIFLCASTSIVTPISPASTGWTTAGPALTGWSSWPHSRNSSSLTSKVSHRHPMPFISTVSCHLLTSNGTASSSGSFSTLSAAQRDQIVANHKLEERAYSDYLGAIPKKKSSAAGRQKTPQVGQGPNREVKGPGGRKIP